MPAQIDLAYAQQLCDLVFNELGYGCSFMSEGGAIVASSYKERMGSIHKGAARVMRREVNELQVTQEDAAASRGQVKEGVNIAIDVDGERVASCGVAGPLEKVKPLARVLSLFIRSMIQREQLDKTHVAEVAAERASAAKIAEFVETARAISADAIDASRKTDASVAELAAATKRIGQMAGYITRIASEINILSLNAAIEAARAGVAGNCFAVVADEVKSLSTLTTKTTSDITDQISELQSATDEVRNSTSAFAVTVAEVNRVISAVAETMAVGLKQPCSAKASVGKPEQGVSPYRRVKAR